jgi:hypothetical protein
MPLYMQVSRDGMILHLSEPHGDGTPGSAIFADVQGLEAFHSELLTENYRYLRPGIGDAPWNARCMDIIDPFGNSIRFSEAKE